MIVIQKQLPSWLGERQSLIDVFDFMAFHTPNCKLVSKSYARLLYNDFPNDKSSPEFASLPQTLRDLEYEESRKSKDLEKAFLALSQQLHASRIALCIRAPSLCGNMYTASLYCSLITVLSHVVSESLQGKTIGMFSYGSGIASTLFTLQVVGDVTGIIEKIHLFARLEKRRVASPYEYDEVYTSLLSGIISSRNLVLLVAHTPIKACQLREAGSGTANFTPRGDLASIGEGVYYLESTDEQYRRKYSVKAKP